MALIQPDIRGYNILFPWTWGGTDDPNSTAGKAWANQQASLSLPQQTAPTYAPPGANITDPYLKLGSASDAQFVDPTGNYQKAWDMYSQALPGYQTSLDAALLAGQNAAKQQVQFDPNAYFNLFKQQSPELAAMAQSATAPLGQSLSEIAARNSRLGGEAALAAMPGLRDSGAAMDAYGGAYARPFADAAAQTQAAQLGLTGNLWNQAMGLNNTNYLTQADLQNQSIQRQVADYNQQAGIQSGLLSNAQNGLGNLGAAASAIWEPTYQLNPSYGMQYAPGAAAPAVTSTTFTPSTTVEPTTQVVTGGGGGGGTGTAPAVTTNQPQVSPVTGLLETPQETALRLGNVGLTVNQPQNTVNPVNPMQPQMKPDGTVETQAEVSQRLSFGGNSAITQDLLNQYIPQKMDSLSQTNTQQVSTSKAETAGKAIPLNDIAKAVGTVVGVVTGNQPLADAISAIGITPSNPTTPIADPTVQQNATSKSADAGMTTPIDPARIYDGITYNTVLEALTAQAAAEAYAVSIQRMLAVEAQRIAQAEQDAILAANETRIGRWQNRLLDYENVLASEDTYTPTVEPRVSSSAAGSSRLTTQSTISNPWEAL